MPRLHEGELEVTEQLVRSLVDEQFPALAEMGLRPFASTGTVNAIYRIGDELSVRLPLLTGFAESLEREWRWLPELAANLTLDVPRLVGMGRPSQGYPCPWAIYEWMDGTPYEDDLVADEASAAKELARFVSELSAIAPSPDAPSGGRRPLAVLATETRDAIAACAGDIDDRAAARAWEEALEAPVFDGDPVWVHTDLLRPNLLVRGGRLSGVIDFGGVGIGDPAADLIAAWSVFGPAGREEFCSRLTADDGTWCRAKGYALHQAALIIPYYRETNPRFVEQAIRTVSQVLTD